MQGVDDLFLAADHDRQPGFLRPDVAAGDRGIDRVHALLASAASAISTASDGSLVVMSTRMFPALQPASAPLSGTETPRGRRRENRRWRTRRPTSRRPLWASRPSRPPCRSALGLLLAARVNGGGKALVDEVPAHALAHHAGADPANFRLSPVRSSVPPSCLPVSDFRKWLSLRAV